MNRLFHCYVVALTSTLLLILRRYVWVVNVALAHGIDVTHRIERIRDWARRKIDNETNGGPENGD